MPARRWSDLSWAEHPVIIEYAPVRVSCQSCLSHPLEWIAWADRQQHQTRRLQQQLAVQAMSMPISHVAALHGLDWSTVRRCQDAAVERWEKTRPQPTLRQVGVDEKYLGRRNKCPSGSTVPQTRPWQGPPVERHERVGREVLPKTVARATHR
jgi:transposase